MTDNDLRKSRHWRCSQCGSSWPLDMAVCGNPACGAELGIYGQVIEPEPEKPPEPEKKPPRRAGNRFHSLRARPHTAQANAAPAHRHTAAGLHN